MTTNAWKYIAIAVITFFTLEHLILCAGMIGIVSFAQTYPKNAELAYHAPETVKADEPFILAFEVYNTGDSARTLEGIHIPQAYLDRVKIGKITPRPREEPFESLGDMTVYMLNRRISAGKHMRIEIEVTAEEPGTCFGVFEVWLSAGITGNCFGVPVRTVVE